MQVKTYIKSSLCYSDKLTVKKRSQTATAPRITRVRIHALLSANHSSCLMQHVAQLDTRNVIGVKFLWKYTSLVDVGNTATFVFSILFL